MATPRIKSCQEITAQPTLPDANGYTWLFDSTNLERSFSTTALGKTATLPSPGPNRGGAKNARIMVTAGVTGQNASLVCYRLDGAGAWRLFDTTALTAGDSPQGVKWDIFSPDCLVGVLAGASAPSAITTTFLMTEQP